MGRECGGRGGGTRASRRGEDGRDRGERGSVERVGACGSLMGERIVEQQMLSLVEFQEAPARGAGGAQAESVGA